MTGADFKTVQKEVAQILEGRILVGHAIHNDLKVQYCNRKAAVMLIAFLYAFAEIFDMQTMSVIYNGILV